MEKLQKHRALYILILISMILLILYLLILVRPILSWVLAFIKEIGIPFLFALIIAYLLHPIVNWFVRRGIKRVIALLLIYLIFFLGAGFLFYKGGPILLNQYRELSEHLPIMFESLNGWIDRLQAEQHYFSDGLRLGIEETKLHIEQEFTQRVRGIVDNFGSQLSYLTAFMLIPFIVFYILKDYERFHQFWVRIFPRKQRKKILIFLRDVNEGMGNYIRGQLLVASFLGILVYIGYLLIGLPYPLVFGLITMVFNIVPYLGPFISAAPAILTGLTISWKVALLAGIVNLIAQIIEGNILSPFIVGKTTQIHPLMIIFAVLIGGKLWGLAGLILAVPILVFLKVTIYHVVDNFVRD